MILCTLKYINFAINFIQEIDGQSFLMLDLPTIQNYMNLKLGPAIKLAHLVERLKLVYFQQYKTADTTTLRSMPLVPQQQPSPVLVSSPNSSHISPSTQKLNRTTSTSHPSSS